MPSVGPATRALIAARTARTRTPRVSMDNTARSATAPTGSRTTRGGPLPVPPSRRRGPSGRRRQRRPHTWTCWRNRNRKWCVCDTTDTITTTTGGPASPPDPEIPTTPTTIRRRIDVSSGRDYLAAITTTRTREYGTYCCYCLNH